MKKYMTATQCRKNFYTVLQTVQKPGEYVIITHEAEPKGVIMSFDQFEQWKEKMKV